MGCFLKDTKWNIGLRPFERSDFAQLILWISSADYLMQWGGLLFQYPLSKFQLESYLQKTGGVKPERLIFKAVFLNSGIVIGHAELDQIDYQKRTAVATRIMVGEQKLRGQGYGEQIVRQLLGIAFKLNLDLIELIVFDFNIAAIKCYQKAGFKIAGYVKDGRKVGDEYWSYYKMRVSRHQICKTPS